MNLMIAFLVCAFCWLMAARLDFLGNHGTRLFRMPRKGGGGGGGRKGTACLCRPCWVIGHARVVERSILNDMFGLLAAMSPALPLVVTLDVTRGGEGSAFSACVPTVPGWNAENLGRVGGRIAQHGTRVKTEHFSLNPSGYRN